MPVTWIDLPEDDPIFQGGVRFGFGPETPDAAAEEEDESSEGEDE